MTKISQTKWATSTTISNFSKSGTNLFSKLHAFYKPFLQRTSAGLQTLHSSPLPRALSNPRKTHSKSIEEELPMDRGLRHLRWDEGWAHTLLCAVSQALTTRAWSGGLMEVLFLLFLMPLFLPTWPHQSTWTALESLWTWLHSTLWL